jgi:hypothetical protein
VASHDGQSVVEARLLSGTILIYGATERRAPVSKQRKIVDKPT